MTGARLPLALLALFCFAANSVLARLALRSGAIDPAAFTAVRLAAGAVFLAVLVGQRGRGAEEHRGRGFRPLLLFLYAAPFSFAYLTLATGTGALILFGAVQVTMIGAGLRSGERPLAREWVGLGVAGLGLLYLNLPGLDAPDLAGALLMGVAGAAWGAYSLLGRRSQSPLADTASSFLLAAPFGAALALVAAPTMGLQISGTGLAYAAASGALASGGGYAAWYAVLPRMSATRAGTIQLAVPVLAALAGTAILGEPVSLRLVASGSAILGGIGLALSAKSQLRH